jgi:hypothetical protein
MDRSADMKYGNSPRRGDHTYHSHVDNSNAATPAAGNSNKEANNEPVPVAPEAGNW